MKKMIYGVAGLALAPAAGYMYSRYAEPGWLRTTEVTITLKRLPPSFDGMRIVQFSDVHLGFHYTTEQLAGLAGRIQALNPDLICFTGDLYDSAVGSDAIPTVEVLSRLHAPLGKGAVLGNHDYYGKESEKIISILTDGGFSVLMNRSVPLQRGQERIWLGGVDDMWDGRPDLPRTLQNVPENECVILLAHCPDYADLALKRSVDLQLSGHSHGGQVRLPLFGPVVLPAYGRKYVAGHYVLGGGKLQVYTNRGIGVSVYPVRFNCRPELTVLTLRRG
ncbi:metallophosphoesterase [Paenibacillus sp. H1-7]|uniref:metallophosphoesterase n=1 Tax=Paenibacillus sp. H1-7 TaxID=2282849 RepID=UPI001EF7FB71|nr:metallophosphoesterase [Paenibacillus sp. H1-7]